jgi:hypothetical protein
LFSPEISSNDISLLPLKETIQASSKSSKKKRAVEYGG